jgi:hypothetical protein
VGLELLAEAGNYAAVQRMLQTNPYWAAYDPHTVSLVSNLDAILLRQSAAAAAAGAGALTQSAHPSLPVPTAAAARMFLQGLQQHVTCSGSSSVRQPVCSSGTYSSTSGHSESPRLQAIV